MTPTLMFVGTSAGAGKTVYTRAACRLLSDRGLRVAPFKPVVVTSRRETHGDLTHDFRLWLLGEAARTEIEAAHGPVQIIKRSPASGTLVVAGETLGEVSLLAEDTPLLDRLEGGQRTATDAVVDALAKLAESADALVIEGAGSCTDLLGSPDLANAEVAERSGAVSVLIAGARPGGAIAGMRGTLLEMPESLRSSVRALSINDVRGGAAHLERQAERLAREFGVDFVGALPHCSIYDDIPPGENSTLCDREAEYDYLANYFTEYLDVEILDRMLFDDAVLAGGAATGGTPDRKGHGEHAWR